MSSRSIPQSIIKTVSRALTAATAVAFLQVGSAAADEPRDAAQLMRTVMAGGPHDGGARGVGEGAVGWGDAQESARRILLASATTPRQAPTVDGGRDTLARYEAGANPAQPKQKGAYGDAQAVAQRLLLGHANSASTGS
jgi:hypothetical protein